MRKIKFYVKLYYRFLVAVLLSPFIGLRRGVLAGLFVSALGLIVFFIYQFQTHKNLSDELAVAVSVFLFLVPVTFETVKEIVSAYRKMRYDEEIFKEFYSSEEKKRAEKSRRQKAKKRKTDKQTGKREKSQTTQAGSRTPTIGELLMKKQRRVKVKYDPLKDPDRDSLTLKYYLENYYIDPLKREFSKIVGQETAKKLILSIIPKHAKERLISGIKHKPVSFLLVGKTGVGKTETAKRVAEALKGAGYVFFRIDANQLRTPESVQSLFGSPRGYIGSDSVPLFIKCAVESGGKMVILIDEIEKAHPEFIQAFMTLLDEGEVTYTTTGERVALRESLIFITSNLKADEISREVAKEKSEVNKLLKAKQLLKDVFLPEILGRINYVVPFEDLKPSQYVEIIRKKLEELSLSSDRETALKLYAYFEKKGVLNRGVREVIKTIETLKLFPDELDRILKETEPADVPPEKKEEKSENSAPVIRRPKGKFDPKYGRVVYRMEMGSRTFVIDGETGEKIAVEKTEEITPPPIRVKSRS